MNNINQKKNYYAERLSVFYEGVEASTSGVGFFICQRANPILRRAHKKRSLAQDDTRFFLKNDEGALCQ